MIKLPPILPAPPRPMSLDSSAKWLAGEGAGSWFVIEETVNSAFEISRFSPDGNLECGGVFTTSQPVNLQEEFIISYPSHCAVVTIEQMGTRIHFKLVS